MLKRINLTGNPNLGVYITVTDNIAIIPLNLPEVMENALKEALEVETIRTTIAGSNLNGALAVGNSNGLIVSPHALDKEVATIESFGINVSRLNDKYTAVGNIIAANDNGAIASNLLSIESKKIVEKTLDIKVESASIGGFNIIGSLICATNKGALLHPQTTTKELELAEKVFKVEGNIGTVNHGIGLVGACSVANSKGVVVGEDTTGIEMARIEESLGFLEGLK
ncbi:MAG: translation initiation factor IF-6 [Methanobacteriaceae archaeon]